MKSETFYKELSQGRPKSRPINNTYFALVAIVIHLFIYLF